MIAKFYLDYRKYDEAEMIYNEVLNTSKYML